MRSSDYRNYLIFLFAVLAILLVYDWASGAEKRCLDRGGTWQKTRTNMVTIHYGDMAVTEELPVYGCVVEEGR